MTEATHKSLLVLLRNRAPSKVRAYSGDDDHRDIAVPTRRRKWDQVIQAIDARSWSRVVLLDKSGAELATFENVEPAGEVEALDGGKVAKLRSESEWIVRLCMTSVKEALASRDNETKALLAAQGDVVRSLTESFRVINDINRDKVEAAKELATIQATAAAGGDNTFKELLEAGPQLLQMLPMLKGLLGAADKPKPAAEKPKNGA